MSPQPCIGYSKVISIVQLHHLALFPVWSTAMSVIVHDKSNSWMNSSFYTISGEKVYSSSKMCTLWTVWNLPVSKDFLKIVHNRVLISLATLFNTISTILCTPGDIFSFNLIILETVFAGVISTSFSIWHSSWSNLSLTSSALTSTCSLVNTEPKRSLICHTLQHYLILTYLKRLLVNQWNLWF